MGKSFYSTETVAYDIKTGEVTAESVLTKESKKFTEPDYVKVYIEAMILTLGKGRQFSSETNLLFAMAKRMTYANSEMPMVVGMTGLVKKMISEETGMSISFIDKTLTTLKKKDLIRNVANERGYYQIDPRIFGRGNYKDIYSLQIKWTANTYERGIVSSTEE